jgi:hypothetical protein
MSKDLNYTLSLKDLFSKQMRGAADSTTRMDSAMSKVGATIAGAFAVGSVVSFGKAVIESLKNYESFHASLRTMLQGNTNAANALEGQLVNLAKTTPFELVQVQKATRQLLGYGFRAGEIVETMKTLGDVSSGVGAPLEDITYLYGTLKTSGRVTLMDLRQFAGRGIPIYETLAKRLNTTTEAITSMVSTGKIGFKDIEGAFKDMNSQGGQFFGMMDEQMKTVGGKISNLADTWEQIKVNIGKSQTGIIAGTIDFMNKMLNAVNRKITAENILDSTLKGTGLESNFLSKFYNDYLGLKSKMLVGDRQSLKNTAAEYQSITETGGGSFKDIAQNLQYFSDVIKRTNEQAKAGKISNEFASAKILLAGNAVKQLQGSMSVLKSKPNDKLNATEKEKLASLKPSAQNSGVNITAARPQSLTINITKLVENLNLSTQTLKEGTSKIREEISKVFLEMVNDANLITR